MNRVVITGQGAVSSAGIGADALWQACLNGVTGVREIDLPELPDQKVKFGASIADTVTEAIDNKREARFQDRIARMARLAANEAVQQAGLGEDDFGSRCGVVIGSGFGGAETLDTNYLTWAKGNATRLDALAIPKIMNNASASWLSMEFGITGPTLCISTACSSAGQSLGLAMQLVRSGVVDRCLAGGAEACLVSGTFRAWEVLRVMTPTLCRPFSSDRNGMVLGEGAGVFVLETYESAKTRGAEILAELVGYGTTCDAGDLLRPDPAGAAGSMGEAIRDSGLTLEDVGYVNAHGTATVANDITETEALRRVFGRDLKGVEMSSTKPIHGHALGAAGALEMIVTVQALRNQIAPPTINFTSVDPQINIDPVANTAREISTNACMSNSFAFGGINASLVIAREGTVK